MDILLKNMPKLADRMKYVRHVAGLSQVEVAQIAGATQQAIQQAETGQALRPRYLPQLANALGIAHSWLSLNVLPEDVKKGKYKKGLSEKDSHILGAYNAMPKKQQKIMLELMESQKKPKK